VRSPYDDELLGRVPECGPNEVDRAVAVAKAAREHDPLPQWKRAEILDTAARLLGERVEKFAATIAGEAAKPIKTARIEAQRAVDTLAFSAAVARTASGELVALDASAAGVGKFGFVLRVPVGVVAAISPFNFPLNLVCHKVGPAIAAGCPVVLKPASATPLSALALADLLIDECGLPEGWLNVVTCPGSVANHLVDHADVAMITFTGSADVGWGIRARAPRKKVSLELGNNAPVVIEPDSNWQAAVTKIKVAGYSHAGQSCISTQRVYVHRAIADDFSAALVAEVESLVVGDPADERTDVSALIDADEVDRVVEWIAEAVAGGARVACGGRTQGRLLLPTVLCDVTPDMKVCAKEVFGPVVTVQAYDDFDVALALADDSTYGLQAAVFTADIGKAMRAARSLHYGGVLVNEVPTWRADHMPYGGVRDSGNTREGPAYAVREMTLERLVVVQP
ncbi:MAG TPA: aldehyde dehydrogenase family protein, partial [Acidimicrobiales bacterium]|nr:aldehyde dehydrogenase family protein [Acidimicrobiales bacterium]